MLIIKVQVFASLEMLTKKQLLSREKIIFIHNLIEIQQQGIEELVHLPSLLYLGINQIHTLFLMKDMTNLYAQVEKHPLTENRMFDYEQEDKILEKILIQ